MGTVTVQTTRIHPQVVKRRFLLKPKDSFSPSVYEQAQNKLHDMRIFKKLQFSTQEKEDKVDIHIKAEDGFYFFPLGFFSSGDKNALFLSLFEGNFLKRGETAFITAGISDDGYSLSGGLALEDNFFNLSFTKLDTDLRFYPDHWSSTQGVLSIAKDKDKFGPPLYTLDMQDYALRFLYARQFGNFSAFIAPQLKHVSYSRPLDGGNHNQIAIGLAYRNNMRSNASMGAVFGFGLSDKYQTLTDMPTAKHAYAAEVSFSKGGSWIGADYNTTHLTANFLWKLELKQHHIFSLQLKAQDGFSPSFSEQVLSTDLLGKQGKYRRLIRGERGAGLTAAFMYYLLRNDTGLLALTPFYELAYVYTSNSYQDHSGTGATLSYKFWRFPFPLGINYTRNLSDQSQVFSFVFGGQF